MEGKRIQDRQQDEDEGQGQNAYNRTTGVSSSARSATTAEPSSIIWQGRFLQRAFHSIIIRRDHPTPILSTSRSQVPKASVRLHIKAEVGGRHQILTSKLLHMNHQPRDDDVSGADLRRLNFFKSLVVPQEILALIWLRSIASPTDALLYLADARDLDALCLAGARGFWEVTEQCGWKFNRFDVGLPLSKRRSSITLLEDVIIRRQGGQHMQKPLGVRCSASIHVVRLVKFGFDSGFILGKEDLL